MSSLINQTTGECISGTCVSTEMFAKIPWYGWIGIILVGAICITVGIILLNPKQIKEQSQRNKLK